MFSERFLCMIAYRLHGYMTLGYADGSCICEYMEEKYMGILLTEEAATGSFGGMYMISLILMFVVMYFILIRPQKKEQKRTAAMLADMSVGDCVLTTSGFYGIVIDITDDTIIVEFGSNKNCRIPMKKSAVAQVEKADAE